MAQRWVDPTTRPRISELCCSVLVSPLLPSLPPADAACRDSVWVLPQQVPGGAYLPPTQCQCIKCGHPASAKHWVLLFHFPCFSKEAGTGLSAYRPSRGGLWIIRMGVPRQAGWKRVPPGPPPFNKFGSGSLESSLQQALPVILFLIVVKYIQC